MNRSFISVLLGGFGETSETGNSNKIDKNVKSGGATIIYNENSESL